MKSGLTFAALLSSIILLTGCGKKETTQTGTHSGESAPPPASSMPWQDPTYKTDTRATQAESRPGPQETGWTEWLKHHEDRKRWCGEQEVDLLMVGDSIVFGWSRLGKPVWDAYYGDRKAVNIGSSGDATFHMLWHFQNGGLDGMKDRNPKLVVMMIGTNNRGEPELKGEDTAYGILALLKEIHAKLPQSKILLMPIFPRGKTPEDEGRLRNQEINKILATYVDNKTVHWLDIGHVFLDDQSNLKTELMPDGLHPNIEGYRVWAKAMEPTIRELLGEPAEAANKIRLEKNQLKGPDLIAGGTISKESTHSWVLGATGARGWTYSEKFSTSVARQIGITEVAKGSPADGVLSKGDVILGASGDQFSHDARVEFGKALTAAEGEDGKLSLIRWRDGALENVTIQLPVLGNYSATAPYDCSKSEKILTQTAEALARRMIEPSYEKQNAISRSLNALGLLATGDPKYQPLLKREAQWASNFSEQGFAVWWYGYVTTFLAEYAIATGDQSVLPGLRRIAIEASKGQSAVGSWGHRFAGPDGRLFGYGMMHSPGVVMTIGLVLAREAGVDEPEVAVAIERSTQMIRFYIGKGSVPYGDHAPYMVGHEDNGKNGMAAVLFDTLGDEKGTEFFSKMSTAAHGNERDQGHTGNFFNMTWAMPSVSRGGPEATGAWMHEFGAWYYDLARTWNFEFPFPGQPKENIIAHNGWDMTGAFMLAYAMPLKATIITGKKPSSIPPFDAKAARQLIHDGRGYDAAIPFDAYDRLTTNELLEQLASWSPIVRDRTATVIAKVKNPPVEKIIAMLDAPTVEARLGACQALTKLGSQSAPAVPKLIETLDHSDLWLRVQAAEALAAIGQPAMEAVPKLLHVVAKGPTGDDPRAMEQRHISQILFNSKNGMLKNSLEGVDRAMLLQAVRAGLSNQDGRTRGSFASVYSNLSIEQLSPILPDIHRAIVEKSPSGIMFDGQIQYAGLDLYSRHHVREGIQMIADYTRLQKAHGSDSNLPKLLNMLKRYGTHAKLAIPSLRETIRFLEDPERKDFPLSLGRQMAEVVRKEIREIEKLNETPELIDLKQIKAKP